MDACRESSCLELSGLEIDDDLVDRVAGRDEGAVERTANRQQQSDRKAYHCDQATRQVRQPSGVVVGKH